MNASLNKAFSLALEGIGVDGVVLIKRGQQRWYNTAQELCACSHVWKPSSSPSY